MFTPEFIDVLREFGFPVAVLLGLGVTGFMGIWVWGRELKKAERQSAEWREIALRALGVAERKDKLNDGE